MPQGDPVEFRLWLETYGRAWEDRNAEAAGTLFTPDAPYFWTPFGSPVLGRPAIVDAWNGAVSTQQDVRFSFDILSWDPPRGIAHWNTEFTRISSGRRVHLDGIFVVILNDVGLCSQFREWWHSDEPPRS